MGRKGDLTKGIKFDVSSLEVEDDKKDEPVGRYREDVENENGRTEGLFQRERNTIIND